MVRLLQIAGVGALLVAGVVLASLNPWRPLNFLHLGISQDPEAAKFLNTEGADTRLDTRKDSQASGDQDKTSPLVRQAQTLESIINPRVPPTAPATTVSARTPSTAVLRPPTAAKFDLVGISYLQSDPESSFAYIRLPDNTYQWVRQGSEVGHLTIKQVKNDSIICFDGQRMSEMKVEPTVDTASLLEVGAVPSGPAATGLFKGAAAQPVSQPGARASLSDRITAGSSPLSARLSAEDEASLNELAHRLKELKATKPNQIDSNAASAEMDKLISEAKSSRISAEEAQKLEKLGEQAEEKRREAMRRMGPPRPPKQ